MADVSQNIIDKILKCLKMADSAEYNPHEAANAMRLAQKLAEQYNLDFAELEAQKQNVKSNEIKYETGELRGENRIPITAWTLALMNAVCTLFGTHHYISSFRGKGTVTFFGVKQDAFITREAFEILRKSAARFARHVYGQQQWRKEHAAFALGFAHEIHRRAGENKRAAQQVSNSTALVVVNKEQQVDAAFKQLTANFGTHKQRAQRDIDASAYNVGRRKGNEVNLNFAGALK